MSTEPVTARQRAAASSTPRRAGVAGATLAALLVSGCAAGRDAQTVEQRPTLDGTNANVGSIALRGISIDPPPSSTPFYAVGSDVAMRLVLVNNGEQSDTLTSITSPAIGGWGSFAATPAATTSASATPSASPTGTVAPPTGSTSIVIAASKAVSWGVPDSTGQLKLRTLRRKLYPGTTVPLTFVFRRAGSVTTQVPVQLTTSPNRSVIPGPSATGEFH